MTAKSSNDRECPESTTFEKTVAAGQKAIGGAVDQAKAAASSAIETTKEMASTASENTKSAGTAVATFVRENPVPTALAGISLGWLWMCARRQAVNCSGRSLVDYDDGTDTNSWRKRELSAECAHTSTVAKAVNQTQETLGQIAGQVKDRAESLAGQAQERAGRAADWSKKMFVEHPLTVGVAAAAVGAAVGLSLPQSDQENRVLAPARSLLADKGKRKVREIGQRALDAAEQSIDQAKNSIEELGTEY